jgi:iron-sulfur cluster repair protein YtfE (RIC family)
MHAETASATPITADDPLNAIVARYPSTLPAMRRFGLDTCCGGAVPLRTAAEHHGLDLDELIVALQQVAGATAQ